MLKIPLSNQHIAKKIVAHMFRYILFAFQICSHLKDPSNNNIDFSAGNVLWKEIVHSKYDPSLPLFAILHRKYHPVLNSLLFTKFFSFCYDQERTNGAKVRLSRIRDRFSKQDGRPPPKWCFYGLNPNQEKVWVAPWQGGGLARVQISCEKKCSVKVLDQKYYQDVKGMSILDPRIAPELLKHDPQMLFSAPQKFHNPRVYQWLSDRDSRFTKCSTQTELFWEIWKAKGYELDNVTDCIFEFGLACSPWSAPGQDLPFMTLVHISAGEKDSAWDARSLQSYDLIDFVGRENKFFQALADEADVGHGHTGVVAFTQDSLLEDKVKRYFGSQRRNVEALFWKSSEAWGQ